MLYLSHPILRGKPEGSGSSKCRPLLPRVFVRQHLPARVAPPFYFHSVREPLGSAYPFRYKSNTRYVPLTRKVPKYKVLMYYFPSWQTYSLPFLTMNIFWGAIMCQAPYWTLGIWIRQFAHPECLANYDTMSVIYC